MAWWELEGIRIPCFMPLVSTFLFQCSQGVEEGTVGASYLSFGIEWSNIHVFWHFPEVIQAGRPRWDCSAAPGDLWANGEGEVSTWVRELGGSGKETG